MNPPRWQNDNTSMLREELMRRVQEEQPMNIAAARRPVDKVQGRRSTIRLAVAFAIALAVIVPASYFAFTNAPRSGDTGSAPLTSPVSSPVSSPSSTATSSAPQPNATRSATQCTDASLTVTLGTAGGTAGTLHANVVFTNTGAVPCVLRGAPGVSVVGGGNGAQIGVPASRDQSDARDVTLAAHGGQAHALLTILDLFHGDFAPTGCNVVAGEGYRIYPPHSTRAYHLPQNEIYACSGTPVFLHVGVVSSGAK